MELLQYLVERSIQSPRAKFDPLFLGMQLYSRKWFFHPGKDEHKEHLKFFLESFAESGELKRDDGGYVLSGKALETLSNHELEKQQHRDNLATARVGNNLTWAIVIVGILGIGAQLAMWWLDRGGTVVPNNAKHSDSFSVAVSPPLQSRTCRRR